MLLLLKFARYFLSVFFISCSSCSFAQSGIIKGWVREGENALPGATVLIANHSILTNAEGRFLLPLAPGKHVLFISHVGYKKYEKSFTLNSGDTISFEIILINEEKMEEIVVLGTRSLIQRSNLNTTVPVDLISSKQLKQTGQLSLMQMMSFVTPSFNTSRQNLYEPATLRGLGPDHLLILLNGIRFHNTAYVNTDAIRGTLGTGGVGNDLSSIPFSAIEKIEILRDGASAQYGSDAIAGVMNIVLKETYGKTLVSMQLGQHYKEDGESILLGINHGIKLQNRRILSKRHGFFNISGEFRYRFPTHRGGEYLGTVYYNVPANASAGQRDSITALDNAKIAERGFNRKVPVSNDGNIRLRGFGILVNGTFPLTDRVELFWTSCLNYRYVVNQGAYRFPKTITEVNTDLWPDGFKTEPSINSRNISTIAGIKGRTNSGWNWELNSTYGENSNQHRGSKTNNASQYFLGANAPTEFYGGTTAFSHQVNYIRLAKDFAKEIRKVNSFHIGFGGEFRFEHYSTSAGDEASWKDYDSSGIRTGGAAGTIVINPGDVVNESRQVAALYADIETEINDNLLVDIAGRVEKYNDFGSNFAGKFSVRYKLSSAFSLRGSFSNGYHAPGLQQIYLTSTGGASWKNIGGVNIPVRSGIFNNASEITHAFGVKPLRPERAVNISIGFTSAISRHIKVTADAYWIQIKNRIVLSGIFNKDNPYVNTILQSRPDIDQVQFITNAINTRTYGMDIVLNGNWRVNTATFGFTLAANFTRTRLFGIIQSTEKLPLDSMNTNTLFNRVERAKIENSQPASKIILSLNYTKGKAGILIRSTRFGETSIVLNSINRAQDEFFSAKIFTDINFTYSPKTWVTLTAGINNVFDVYPDPVKNPINQNQGILIYSNQGTPYGYNGGYYFLSIGFDW